jgi:hypothetical protein
MPTASELQQLFDKDYVIDQFINESVRNVELAARYGRKSERIDVPQELSRFETNDKIRKTFQGCKISWIWYAHAYKISWKQV